MAERKNYSEEYARMSPLERNQEFHRLYDQLPIISYDPNQASKPFQERPGNITKEELSNLVETIFSPRADERQHSEHKAKLSNRLCKLLAFASVTEFFQDYIAGAYETLYLVGVSDNPEEYPNSLFYILDPDKADSEGIFSPERAQVLEKDRYLETAEGNKNTIEFYEQEKRHQIVGAQDDWRRQFVECYGFEPQ